eukprot:m.45067 g.45067  ORF g.45067 m.45067 type:complete len:388 (-) comp10971_c0_seq1:48-1211(-)
MADGVLEDIINTLQQLIAIPSVNPAQATDHTAGELRYVLFLKEQFEKLGAEVVLECPAPDRPNLYALFQVDASLPWIGVDVHADTVSVAGYQGDPFAGQVDSEGRLHGRGSCDTKAGIAVCLATLRRLKALDRKLPRNLLVSATIGEETSTIGARAFAAFVRARIPGGLSQLMVCEPTLCRPIYGHKGLVQVRFEVAGRAVHSSQPALGANALVAAASAILALTDLHHSLQGQQNLLGPPSVCVTLAQGGSGINIVPSAASFSVDRRVVHEEDPDTVERELLAFVQAHFASSPSCVGTTLTHTTIAKSPSFCRSPDDPLVALLATAGGAPPAVAHYGTNASSYGVDVARSCAIFGPGSIEQAHQVDEWVAVSELQKMADIVYGWWLA